MSTASWLAISPAAAPPMPSQTAKSAPWGPTTHARLLSSRPRTFRLTSATRKLSSLCSRICPTSVRANSLMRISPATTVLSLFEPPATSPGLGVSGCVTRRRSPWSCSGATRVDVEAEELLSDAEMVAVPETNLLPDLQEGAVGGSQIGQSETARRAIASPAALNSYDGVPARQERIVGEYDIPRFASDDRFAFAQMEYVSHNALYGALAEARIA